MKIACVQFAPSYREVARNLDRIRELVRKAEAEIIIFPELALTGYFFKTREEIGPLAEPIDGPLSSALSNLARMENKAIITGFLEEAEGTYYNTSLAFHANGQLAGKYRKVHLFYYETQIFSPGNLGFPVFPLQTRTVTLNVGMMICYDWRFPEAARTLALRGADLIAMPSNIVSTTGMLHPTLQTRAFENKIALAFANRFGAERNDNETLRFTGGSAIINLNGDILSIASPDKEGMVIAEVDLEKTRNKRINSFNDIFSDRSPASYGL